MNIRFVCSSCYNEEDVTLSAEAPEIIQKIKPICSKCGEAMTLKDLDALVHDMVEHQVNDYVSKWLRELGGDETLSLIKRNEHLPFIEMYKVNLRNRGFIIK